MTRSTRSSLAALAAMLLSFASLHAVVTVPGQAASQTVAMPRLA